MPSLRQPVGPLPASIYWRRRLIVLAALAAILVLIVWLTYGTGGGGGKPKQGAHPAPAQSITPGASPSGSAITSRPGGTGGGGGGGGGTVSGGGGGEVSISTGGVGGSATPGTGSTAGTGGTGGSAGGTGTGGTGGGTGGGAPQVNTADVMALPICSVSQLALELASAQNAYQPKDRPRLALTVRNTSGANCRVDLGRTASTLTVTSSSGERVWSSGDCPNDRAGAWAQIPAGSGLTETFNWDRSRSKPQCATADPTPAQPGNYLVQADLSGPSGGPVSARTSIRLDS
ncbi:hypothetical protein [Kitasatospora terrestris]|uniref:hypothetical protein n=1 Tax=Kitasatospora terrestris TaxID=258051 RepID=UPI0031E81A4F